MGTAFHSKGMEHRSFPQLSDSGVTGCSPSPLNPVALQDPSPHASFSTCGYCRAPPSTSSLPPVCQRLGACHGLGDDGRVLDRSVGGHPSQLLPGGREQDLLSATGPCLLSDRGKAIPEQKASSTEHELWSTLSWGP